MTGPEPCGARTRDIHGNAVCDLNAGHPGGHSGEVMAGIRLSWAAAPPLSPEEREIVDRFERARTPWVVFDTCAMEADERSAAYSYARNIIGLDVVEECDCEAQR